MLPFPSWTIPLSPSSNGATSLNWQEQEGRKLGQKLWNPQRSETESCSVTSDSLTCHGLYSLWNFPGQNTGVGSQSLLQGYLPKPGIKPRFPTLQADSLPAEPPGKPTNLGVGSLSLLQGIFPTQESNQGLLHCRQILYQLSYQGSSWKSFGRH